MPKLSPESVPIVDGKVVLFKRPRSPLWQSRFRIAKKWVRMSTKTDDLDKAKEIAREAYIDAYHRDKNGLPCRHYYRKERYPRESLLVLHPSKATKTMRKTDGWRTTKIRMSCWYPWNFLCGTRLLLEMRTFCRSLYWLGSESSFAKT